MRTASFDRFAFVAVVIAVSLFVVSSAIKEIAVSLESGNIIFAGRRLSETEKFDAGSVEFYKEQAARIVRSGNCRSDVVKAGLMPTLVSLDSQDFLSNYDLWEKSILNTKAYILHALGCFPTDGEIWLRLAMVQQSIGENSAEIASLITQSQRLSPTEGEVVFERLALWRRLEPITVQLALVPLKNDITAACIDPTRLKKIIFKPWLKNILFENAPDNCKPIFKPAAGLVG